MSEYETGGGGAEQQPAATERPGDRAMRLVKRAGKLSADDPTQLASAQLLLRSANVLALLELADAIRESR